MRPLVLALIFAVAPLPASANPSFPKRFTAQYTVAMNGKEAGVMTRTVAKDGADFVFRSELKATKGLYALLRVKVLETSRWRFASNDILPLEYLYRQTGAKRQESTVRFDWSRNTVNVTHKQKTSEIAATQGMLDKLLYQLVLMRDLANGRKPIEYLIVDGNKVRKYPIEMLGEERINTPLGNLDTVKVRYQKPGSERSTTLWCAKSLDYLPVKLDHNEKEGERTSALIKSVSGLGPTATR